jgi:hypothetical protein
LVDEDKPFKINLAQLCKNSSNKNWASRLD